MEKANFKKLVTIVAFLLLAGNATPLFAQLVELEILGGGYKLRGPSEIAFPSLSTTTSDRTSVVSFANIGESTPSQSDYNYLLIIDENGGNPFDVTVTTTELKRDETLQTTTAAGSLDNQLKVTSTTGFFAGDSLSIVEYGDEEDYYQVESVNDETTLTLTTDFVPALPPDPGLTVNRIVRCDLSPKRCISLDNFAIRNGNSFELVHGNAEDFELNSQTFEYTAFRGATTTLTGSSGVDLYVADAYQFNGGEEITFPLDSGVEPLTNFVDMVVDENTIMLLDPFISPPQENIRVESVEIRSLTLGNGTGASPGQWKIFPYLQNTIPAGQLPGTYEGVLNFTIV